MRRRLPQGWFPEEVETEDNATPLLEEALEVASSQYHTEMEDEKIISLLTAGGGDDDEDLYSLPACPICGGYHY